MQVPGVSDYRLTGTSPTYGRVTVVTVSPPGRDHYDLLCRETPLLRPRLIRAWKRWSWIEYYFRLLKHLLATEACQLQGEDAYCGYLVLRLAAGLVVLYRARIICKGKATMDELLFRLKHYWRFLD